jgi:hypothetical protein
MEWQPLDPKLAVKVQFEVDARQEIVERGIAVGGNQDFAIEHASLAASAALRQLRDAEAIWLPASILVCSFGRQLRRARARAASAVLAGVSEGDPRHWRALSCRVLSPSGFGERPGTPLGRSNE